LTDDLQPPGGRSAGDGFNENASIEAAIARQK
jgi:hypothetical protein